MHQLIPTFYAKLFYVSKALFNLDLYFQWNNSSSNRPKTSTIWWIRVIFLNCYKHIFHVIYVLDWHNTCIIQEKMYSWCLNNNSRKLPLLTYNVIVSELIIKYFLLQVINYFVFKQHEGFQRKKTSTINNYLTQIFINNDNEAVKWMPLIMNEKVSCCLFLMAYQINVL